MELKSSLWNQTIERSRIPDVCLSEDVIVGIDEAGRGPVMGSIYVYLLFRTYGLFSCILGKVKK